MHRRLFLQSILGIGAVALVPASALALVAPEVFCLRGDGQHDDGPALRALFRGETVIAPGGSELRMTDSIIRLPAGTYYIHGPAY